MKTDKMQRKLVLKFNKTYAVITLMWLLTFSITGVIYYTSVYGENKKTDDSDKKKTSTKEVEPVDVMFEKTIIGIGDSIMFGKGTDGYTVAQQIADKHSMTVYDYSLSGATIACVDRKTDITRYNIYEQVKEAIEDVERADYIVFNGGTNDMAPKYDIKMGEITKDFDDQRDLSTFCGAMEECIYTLKKNYPNAVIVYVRSHNMKRRDYEDQLIYGETAIKICQKWGIEYADVFNDSEFNTYLERYNQYTASTKKYPAGDYVHPTKEGYELFYLPLIEDAIYASAKKKSL